MTNSQLIIEVFNGYSPIEFEGRELFLRHISLADQEFLNRVFERYKREVIANGINTEQDVLAELKKDNLWLEEEEMELLSQKNFVKNLEATRAKLPIKSQRDEAQKQINEVLEKISALENKRRELVGQTAEDLAHSFSNNEFIKNLIYKDRRLSDLAFTEEDFDEFDYSKIQNLTQLYLDVSKKINDKSIQEVVLQEEFGLYLTHCESPQNLFGKPAIALTLFQLKMVAYGKIFLNIFQNHEIPDKIRKKPQEILDFVESERNKDKRKNNVGEKHKSVGVFGARDKEDLESYDPSAKIINPTEELKKRGGKISHEDMVKIFG